MRSNERVCIVGDVLKGPSVQTRFQRREEETSLNQEVSVICVLGRASAQTLLSLLVTVFRFLLPSATHWALRNSVHGSHPMAVERW